jgi:hypothetical protein
MDILQQKIEDLIEKHNLALDGFTEIQFAEAIRQAIPDFQRNVFQNSQRICYIPRLEAERWRKLYHDMEEKCEVYKNLCDRGYIIAMGDADPSDIDDYITDYNSTFVDFFISPNK